MLEGDRSAAAGALEMNYIDAMGSYNPVPPSRLQRLDRGGPGLDPEILPPGSGYIPPQPQEQRGAFDLGCFASDLSAVGNQLCGLSGDDFAGSQPDEPDA